MRDNSSVFFEPKPYILWTKRAHRSEIFRLLSGWVKIHQIPQVIFETTGQSIKVQNFRLSTAQVKFHQIGTLIGSFSAKKYRGIMSHDSEERCKV